jgi:hypothetical protein
VRPQRQGWRRAAQRSAGGLGAGARRWWATIGSRSTLRRVEDLRRGDIQSTRALISGLPRALGVPAEVVQKAVDDTARQLLDADETAWRASFKPHAIILTDRKIPQPIFVAAMIGVDELLRIDFPLLAALQMYLDLAIDGIRNKLARWNHEFNPRKGLDSYQLP